MRQDAQMVGDTEAAVKWMRAQPNHNGRVGLFGSCSGGRHAFIYACQKKDVDASAATRRAVFSSSLKTKPHRSARRSVTITLNARLAQGVPFKLSRMR